MIFQMYSQPNPQIPSAIEWRWSLNRIACNTVLAVSPHGFSTKELCESNIHLVMLTDYNTPIVEIKEKSKTGVINELISHIAENKKNRISERTDDSS